MIELASLRSEHSQIQRLAQELSHMVMRPLPPQRAELERVRRDFTLGVARHLKHENAVVHPQLLESSDAAVRSIACRLIAESGVLTARFDAYCRRWSSAAIVADWSGFRYASSELLGLIERRMADEENELYPLIDAIGDQAVGRSARWTSTASDNRLQLRHQSEPARP